MVTSLIFCICIAICYFATGYKVIENSEGPKPYEITSVEILCDQDAFEQAVRDGRIAVGKVVQNEDSSSQSSSESFASESENEKVPEGAVRG